MPGISTCGIQKPTSIFFSALLLGLYLLSPAPARGNDPKALLQAPVISQFSPGSGSVGTLLHISGSQLGSPTSVAIGGTATLIIAQSDTHAVCLVMPGSVSGAVSLTTAGGTATSQQVFTVTPTPAPSVQQGSRLETPANPTAGLGQSTALSADGNTLISGAPAAEVYEGGGYVFTRVNGVWDPLPTRLFGSGSIGSLLFQGQSVALSADGNTALVSSADDNGAIGATWVFIRYEDGFWEQQGPKLVGSGSSGKQEQGFSVALSADGNTAVAGAPFDNNEIGAAWVFTRSGSIWSQMGGKLTGIGGSTNKPRQGRAVAISADGNTILMSGLANGSGEGAFYIFTRSGNSWVQTPVDQVNAPGIGTVNAVALSADGQTAIVGNRADGSTGAAWVFSRQGGNWTQLGNKLVGAGGAATAQAQGTSVTLSADGRVAMIGGEGNLSRRGAAWVFQYNGSQWVQQGNKLTGTPEEDAQFQGASVVLSANGSTAALGGPGLFGSINSSVWIFTAPPPSITYTFTGNGNWNVADNWSNGVIPPATLPKGDIIVINPAGSGECVLNVAQTIAKEASLRVEPGKRFQINGNLVVQGE
jgi:hypothetical protein